MKEPCVSSKERENVCHRQDETMEIAIEPGNAEDEEERVCWYAIAKENGHGSDATSTIMDTKSARGSSKVV